MKTTKDWMAEWKAQYVPLGTIKGLVVLNGTERVIDFKCEQHAQYGFVSCSSQLTYKVRYRTGKIIHTRGVHIQFGQNDSNNRDGFGFPIYVKLGGIQARHGFGNNNSREFVIGWSDEVAA